MKKVLLLFAASVVLLACSSKSEKECCSATPPTKAQVVYENIMSRRSIRAYKPDPVSKAQIDTLLQCGINAPSAMNAQTWQVRAILNQDLMARIREVNPNFSYAAPNLLVVASEKNNGITKADCGLLTENILLMANAMGLGTVVLGNFGGIPQNPDAKDIVEKLGFPENYEILFAIAVGYPAESPDARPRDASKAVVIE
ncbi:MAG: nitroreductase family protein [Dysgonamonadaceae bacterium]|jgi:nitroreductase|nr:nitroreductase family protein [Dysgonamonadaceae bacterium]